jgi:AraC family transcriptional regulator
MRDTYDRRSIETLAELERDSNFEEYVPPTLPIVHQSLDLLRSAVVDLLNAVSNAIQDKPEEAYGHVSRATALLRLESPGAIARSDPYDTKSAATPILRGGLAPWQVRKVSAYVETHLHLKLCTANLAAVAKFSVFHFCRAFRTSFGETPHTYVMRRRIERAQGVMLKTRSSLAQIAIDCGLADQAHLCKCFRRFVGESPNVWRRARAAPCQ